MLGQRHADRLGHAGGRLLLPQHLLRQAAQAVVLLGGQLRLGARVLRGLQSLAGLRGLLLGLDVLPLPQGIPAANEADHRLLLDKVVVLYPGVFIHVGSALGVIQGRFQRLPGQFLLALARILLAEGHDILGLFNIGVHLALGVQAVVPDIEACRFRDPPRVPAFQRAAESVIEAVGHDVEGPLNILKRQVEPGPFKAPRQPAVGRAARVQ